jgi:hypothetical protein
MMRKYDDQSRVTEAIRYLVRWKYLKRYVASKVLEEENASGVETRRQRAALSEVK